MGEFLKSAFINRLLTLARFPCIVCRREEIFVCEWDFRGLSQEGVLIGMSLHFAVSEDLPPAGLSAWIGALSRDGVSESWKENV